MFETMAERFHTPEQKVASRLWRAGSAATRYVDEEERRLILQALVVGITVWALVMILKVAAHWGFHRLVTVVDHAPSIAVVLIPLVRSR